MLTTPTNNRKGRPCDAADLLFGDVLFVEGDQLAGDLWQRVLDSEMAGVETVHLSVRESFEIGLATLRGEENVVLAPEDDGFRLPRPQEGLPLRVELDIGPVVVEEIELDLLRVWTFQKMVVHIPIVGADELRPRMAMCIDGLDGLGQQERADRLLRFGRAVLPVIAAQLIPGCSEADLIGVGILDDQPFEPFGVAANDAEADRPPWYQRQPVRRAMTG